MLMGEGKDIDLLVRRLHHILDHFRYFRFGVRCGYSNTAIDQDLVIGAIMLPKPDEDAIAETLTVDTNQSAGACCPAVGFCGATVTAGFFRGALFAGLWSTVVSAVRLRIAFAHLFDLPLGTEMEEPERLASSGVPGGRITHAAFSCPGRDLISFLLLGSNSEGAARDFF